MDDLRPRAIVHLDLAAGLRGAALEQDQAPALLVVWQGDLLLGYGHVHRALTPPELAAHLATMIAPSVGRRLLGPGAQTPWAGVERAEAPPLASATALSEPLRALSPPEHAVPADRLTVTLIVCTRDHPTHLDRCLASVAESDPAPDEVVVVDNAPHLAGTREVVARFDRVRYVAEPRPGLSSARNAGVRAASGDLLAFTDDDVTVHPRWLRGLRRAFAEDDVMAVTGLVLPAELETPAQVTFEVRHGGLALGALPARFDRRFVRTTRAVGMPVWKIGAGANMAIRRAAFDLVGDFDERLGAGAAGCSEDSELWYRLLAEGYACRYEPDSVVLHHHRREPSALRRQIHDYAEGHVAALFVQFARFHHGGNLRRALLALPRHFARTAVRRAARRGLESVGLAQPRGVATFGAEAAGFLRGLGHLPLALIAPPPRHKARLRPFLARNPFGRPYTIGFFYREKMRAIHRIAPDLPVGAVLEVGGGRSGLARMLYPAAHVTTVDLESEHGDAGVNRDPRVTFVVADATALPFADESFDCVTFFDVLEHIPDHQRAASEALRVLRPGGFVLVTTPSSRWRYPYYRALAPICPTDQDLIDEWGHVRRGYSLANLVTLFGRPPVRTAGFITPLTALGHDLAWSRLSEPARRVLCSAVGPLTWSAYALQPAARPGTEIAASWRKPDR